MIALDASVLVAHLYPRDAQHVQATRLLRAAATEQLVAHPLTLAEVLVGAARQGRAAEMLADVQAVGVRQASAPADEPLRLANLRAQTGLRLPDCCALDTALANSATLATFDRALAVAASRSGVGTLP